MPSNGEAEEVRVLEREKGGFIGKLSSSSGKYLPI
jgi:hypothetical protein